MSKRRAWMFHTLDSGSDEDEDGHQYQNEHSEFTTTRTSIKERVSTISTRGSMSMSKSKNAKKRKKNKRDPDPSQSHSFDDTFQPLDNHNSATFQDPPALVDLPIDRAYITYLEDTGDHERLKELKPKGECMVRAHSKWFLHRIRVCIDFCGCGDDEERHIVQLLRAGLYPATIQNPQTVATFDVLDQFKLLTFVSQISGFEFYQALVRKTCNTGLNPPKDRQGHDPMSAVVTRDGQMALLCPACPHPGINMPDRWESSTKPYVHSLFLAIDANVRLKRKNISDPLDPGLVKGGAYFVEDSKYHAHLVAREKEKDPKSSCSRHDAVNLSNSHRYQGHAATGVGKVGERYANMDYLFYNAVSTLQKPISYVVSYDIACQWSVHLQKRLTDMDATFFLYGPEHRIQFLVPKFHLPAHISACCWRFSFNYRRGVGRTDGEAPERGWPVTNALAGSTREMLAGTRRDVLEYQFSDHNWVKITNLASHLKQKLHTAAVDMAEHSIEYNDLSSTIPKEKLAVWIKELDQWESDPDSHPYPFEPEADDGPTLASVRQELAETEERDLMAGTDTSMHDEVSASMFIDLGVTLESKQRAVKKEVSEIWAHTQDRQKTKVLLNTNTLQREIDNWLEYQRLYCPGAERIREKILSERRTKTKSYDFPLLLPSDLKGKTPVDEQLIHFETQLRKGQAHEALARLRSELQIRYHIWWVKNRNTRGQVAGTQANKVLDAANNRINVAGDEYRRAYSALMALSPDAASIASEVLNGGMSARGNQADTLTRTNNAGDNQVEISTLGDPTMPISMNVTVVDKNSASSNTSPPAPLPPSEADLKHVKYEWGKCHTRMTRFEEEVHLVTAETDRIKRYHEFYSDDWKEKALQFDGWAYKGSALSEGFRAYALKKSRMFSDLRENCQETWKDLPDHVSRMRNIVKNPELASSNEFAKSSSSKARAKAGRKAGMQGKERGDDDAQEVHEEE
ncbi:hypothetical protein BJ165DRAFT_1402762 [Panaeolus papilionaceus]|nr:hypothetical protein BJ165DRAFT_1402762 [Panaeolus papilionaceus]